MNHRYSGMHFTLLVLIGWFSRTMLPSEAIAEDTATKSPKLVVTIDGHPVTEEAIYDLGDSTFNNGMIRVPGTGFVLKLGVERELHFAGNEFGFERLFLTTPGRASQIVAVRVPVRFSPDAETDDDPLLALSDEDICGLWGIKLDHWSNDIAEKFKKVDLEHTCIETGEDHTETFDVNARPPFPTEIVHLRINARSTDQISTSTFGDLEQLRRLTKLQSLTIQGKTDIAFDCSLLAQATQLKFLHLYDLTLKNVEALKALNQVQILNISRCFDLKDISFVKSMRELVSLDVNSTEVTDLSSLEGLPKLRTVEAKSTEVNTLPEKLPSLQALNVVETRLTDEQVHAFQHQNIDCCVRHRWNESLKAALQPANRLRIATGVARNRRDPEHEVKTLFETNNVDEIKTLIAGIEVTEEGAHGDLFSYPEPSFEFYKDDKLIVRLTMRPGVYLAWNVWPAPGILTKQSNAFLIEWLANRGVTGPQKVIERRRKRAEERPSNN